MSATNVHLGATSESQCMTETPSRKCVCMGCLEAPVLCLICAVGLACSLVFAIQGVSNNLSGAVGTVAYGILTASCIEGMSSDVGARTVGEPV